MNKKKLGKVTGVATASFLIAGTTAFTAFAAMPSGTAVIGNKAYDLNYVNDPAHQEEITEAMVAADFKVYVKDFTGNWIANETEKALTDLSVIPAVEYKAADGTATKYDAKDGNVTSTDTTLKVDSVSAINDIPAGNMITGSTLNKVFKFEIKANSQKDLNVTAIKVKEFGSAAGDSSDIQRVYLMDGDNVLVSGALNNSEVRLNKPMTIAKGQSKVFTVAIDVNSGAIPTRTIQLGLDSKDSIVSDGDFSGITSPIKGAESQIIAASVGALSTGNSTQGATIVKVGEKNKDLGNFTLTSSAIEGLKIANLTLTTNGLTATNFDNLYLYDDLGNKIDVKGVTSANKVTFTFADKALDIPKGQTKRFSLKGDILAGVNNQGTFQIANTFDVIAKGVSSNANVTVTLGSTPQQLTIANIQVQAGTVALNTTTNIPTKVLATTSQAGMIREFTISAPSEDMVVDTIQTTISSTVNNVNAVFANAYITDENGNVIAGPKAVNAAALNQNLTFNDVNWYISAGQTKKFQVRATTLNDTVTNTGVDAIIPASGIGYTLTTTNTKATIGSVPALAVGYPLATKGTLNASPDATTPSKAYPQGTKAASVAKYLLTAADDSIKVTKLTIAEAASGTLTGTISNVGLYVDGVLVGSVTATPTTDSSFVLDLSSSPLIINKNTTKQVEIKADIDSNTLSPFTLNLTGVTATSQTTNINSSASGAPLAAGKAVTVGSGSLNVVDPDAYLQVVASKVLGNTDSELIKAKYVAGTESVNLKQVELNLKSSDVVSGTVVKNIQVFDGDTLVGTYPSALATSGGTTVTIPLSQDVLVPAVVGKVLTFKAQIDILEPTGETVTAQVAETANTYGVGASSNVVIPATVGAAPANTVVATKVNAKAKVEVAADSPAGDSVMGADSNFIKFTITADGGNVFIRNGETVKLAEAGTIGTKVLDGLDNTVQITDADGIALTTFDTASDTITFTQDVTIAKGETATFYLRNNASGAAAAAGQTLQLIIGDGLDGLGLYDTITAPGGTAIKGETGKITGKVLKY